MARIRASSGSRLLFLFLVLLLALLSWRLVHEEDRREWKTLQRRFNEEFSRTAAMAQVPETAREKVEIHQIFLPEAGVRDLCTTCHLGIDNPLLSDAPQPYRTHPGELLEQHRVNEFGCTLCHRGLGIGTEAKAAHGREDGSADPMLPNRFVESTCIGCHETPFELAGAERLEQGRRLFGALGCYGCHENPGFEQLPKRAPPLDRVRDKLSSPGWAFNWLTQPLDLRPQTNMPDFQLQDDEAADIVAYLYQPGDEPASTTRRARGGSAERGKRLFDTRGCRGCHSAERGRPSPSVRAPNLFDVGRKVRADWLASWLEDPRAYNPETLMSVPTLTAQERRDVSTYLMTLEGDAQAGAVERAIELSEHDPENGRRLFQLYGCYGCHGLEEFVDLPRPGVAVSEVAHKTRTDLPFGNSDVARTKWDWVATKIESPRTYATAEMPLRMPRFRFEDGDVEALTTFYLNNAPYELPSRFHVSPPPRTKTLQRGDQLLRLYNCRGCHAFEEGQEPAIAANLELKTMAPPRLVGEGEKVQPQWLYGFLRQPTVVRPWLEIRMPDFRLTHEDAETLTDTFFELAGDSRATYPYILLPRREDITAEEIEMGEYRVRTDKCVQCHPVTLGAGLPEGVELQDLAINLMLAKSRLRFDWIKNFLRNPDRYAGRDTRMPFVFYDPDGNPKVEDPELWIDLTAKFLMVMEELPEAAEESLEEIRPGSEIDWTKYDQ